MTTKSPVDVVVASGVIMTATTMIRHKRRQQAGYATTLVYGFLVTLAMLIVSIFVPVLARYLAIGGMFGALYVNGPDVFAVVGGLSAPTGKGSIKKKGR